MLQRFFLTLLDMSIAAGYGVVLVMMIRLLGIASSILLKHRLRDAVQLEEGI